MTTKTSTNGTTKTLTITLPLDNGQIGKADEIDVVESLRSFFASSQAYLTSFFSQDSAQWLTSQIKSDFSCDWHQDMLDTNKRHLVEIANYTSNASMQASKIEYLQKQYDTEIGISKGYATTCGTYRNAVDAITAENRLLEDKLEKANEAYIDLADVARDEADAKDAEIIKLKALLWDLTQKLNSK